MILREAQSRGKRGLAPGPEGPRFLTSRLGGRVPVPFFRAQAQAIGNAGRRGQEPQAGRLFY